MKIILAVSGASGSIYAKQLIETFKKLNNQISRVDIVFSDNAKEIWKSELNEDADDVIDFKIWKNNDFMAPFASGSSKYDCMIICPCSMGLIGRIANGFSNDLISRAADVMFKERRKLIIVPRETPYSLIHLTNMKLITESGGIICPATPSFYSNPKTINELARTVTDRIIDLAKIENSTFRWGE